MGYKIIPIIVIMNMLDWTRSSRQGPCAAASTAPRTDSTPYVQEGQERSAEWGSCNSHSTMPTALGLQWATFGQHDKSTQSSSTRSDLQEPLSVPVPRWLLHVPPSLQSPRSAERDSAMLNTITDALNLSELHALTCQGQDGLFQQTRECHLEETVLPFPPI